MKSIVFLFYSMFFIYRFSFGQLTGPDQVCAGFIYTYNDNTPGADSINWTFPVGWVVLNQSNTQVEVLCNKNAGLIVATCFDSLNNLIGYDSLGVGWGGSGMGWQVQTQQVIGCQCPNFTVHPVPQAGTACGICSLGIQSPFLKYGVYKSQWPSTQFVAYANGSDQIPMSSSFAVTYYVYLIDITFGLQNAILIEGGLCSPPIINRFTIPQCMFVNLGIVPTPNPPCVGDTVTLQYNYNNGQYNNYTWQSFNGFITFLPPFNQDHIQCIIDSMVPFSINLLAFSGSCPYAGNLNITPILCSQSPPVASFQSDLSSLCPGTCTNFQNLSTDGISYQWLFPGGSPASDTSANPQGICYFNSGTYDVTLIATNNAGSDTLTDTITVFPPLPFNPITQNGDTLFSIDGYSSYEWFLDSTLIPGANDYYILASQSGNYTVVATDSNGCKAAALLINVIASVNDIQQNNIFYSAKYSAGSIHLKITSSTSSDAEIILSDILGKVVVLKNTALINGNNEIELTDISLSKGIYYINIVFDRKMFSKIISIQ